MQLFPLALQRLRKFGQSHEFYLAKLLLGAFQVSLELECSRPFLAHSNLLLEYYYQNILCNLVLFKSFIYFVRVFFEHPTNCGNEECCIFHSVDQHPNGNIRGFSIIQWSLKIPELWYHLNRAQLDCFTLWNTKIWYTFKWTHKHSGYSNTSSNNFCCGICSPRSAVSRPLGRCTWNTDKFGERA